MKSLANGADDTQGLYAVAFVIAVAELAMVAFPPPYPERGGEIATLYLATLAAPTALNEAARLFGGPVFARIEDVLGVALLSVWAAFTAVWLMLHPGATMTLEYWQCFLGTVQIVLLAHVSRRLIEKRRLDLVHAFIEESIGRGWRQVGGGGR